MTKEQEFIISEYRMLFEENKRDYLLNGSSRYATFDVQHTADGADKSVTIVWNEIIGISDEGILNCELNFINIQEDGQPVNLNKLLSFEQLSAYTKRLLNYA